MEYLAGHWLALLFAATAVALAAVAVIVRGRRRIFPLLLLSTMTAVTSFGGFFPGEWALWVACAALASFMVMLVVVIVSGFWWAPAGYAAAVVFCLGLGGVVLPPAMHVVNDAGKFLLTLEPGQPWWLLLLLLVPLVIALSFRSLSGLGPVRRWVAISLRCLLIVFLVLALADTQAHQPNEDLTVLFLWDRSLSIPQEWDAETGKELRGERIKEFINNAVAQRGPSRGADRVGLIVFGRRPRLELPPGNVPELRLRNIVSPIDDTYTDIAAAIKLALASFPEGTGKRIVLISDGNQNLGNAEEQARIAKQNGVQIDVVPIAAGRRSHNEVLVERVEAPPLTEKGSRLPIRIVLRSYHPQIVVGTLRLIKTSLEVKKQDGQAQPVFDDQKVLETEVRLRPGLNAFFFQQPGGETDSSYIYSATFTPRHVENAAGEKLHDGLPGDRVENNRASVNVMTRGQRAVLLIEPEVGEHKLLVDRLHEQAKSGLRIVSMKPESLPQDPALLAFFLGRFDSVILANVPAERVTDEQKAVLHSNTRDQGCGLIMVGGPQGFGAGGWQDTEVEKALPVTADLKSLKVEGKSGLVLIMHASEMAEGNAWQKKIAKIAIQKLSPMDMVGMLYYAWDEKGSGHSWHIPFQLIGNRRSTMLGLVDSMMPGDMPDVDPALEKAYKELTNKSYGLGTKHIIFISDGDHWHAGGGLMAKLNRAKITCTTVCITTHGQAEVQKMAFMARAISGPKGRSYHIKDPRELPAIYIKESRLVSQSFVHEKPFRPRVVPTPSAPTEGIKEVPDLYGFVRTTRRSSPLVEVPIVTPKISGSEFPILAHWYYGLGKSVAFTSDARTVPGEAPHWDRDWANSEMYGKFWEQTVEWSMRAVETGKHLNLTTEVRDGKVRVVVDARDADKRPLSDVELKGGITSPALKPGDTRRPTLKFEQKNAGVYEAEFKADDVGSYFLTIQAKWKENGQQKTDSVRGGVTIPYSPEFAEMESNGALLERLRDMTGGKSYPDEREVLRHVAAAGEVFRPLPVHMHGLLPLWHWLAVLAGICLFFDVAVRRIALEPAKIAGVLQAWWLRLRGLAVETAATPQFLERLQSRKSQVEETLEKVKAARRFEGGDAPMSAPVGAEETPLPAPPRPPAETPKVGPGQEAQPADYASRLMAAKKRAMEERQKKQE